MTLTTESSLGNRGVLSLYDFDHQSREVVGIEGVFKGCNLIQHTAKRPHVTLVVVSGTVVVKELKYSSKADLTEFLFSFFLIQQHLNLKLYRTLSSR